MSRRLHYESTSHPPTSTGLDTMRQIVYFIVVLLPLACFLVFAEMSSIPHEGFRLQGSANDHLDFTNVTVSRSKRQFRCPMNCYSSCVNNYQCQMSPVISVCVQGCCCPTNNVNLENLAILASERKDREGGIGMVRGKASDENEKFPNIVKLSCDLSILLFECTADSKFTINSSSNVNSLVGERAVLCVTNVEEIVLTIADCGIAYVYDCSKILREAHYRTKITACSGGPAVAACLGGLCGQGFFCTATNFCCRCQSGNTTGPCVNQQCPVGYMCNTNNYCCPLGSGGVLGPCVNGMCPNGYTCGAGNLCYMTAGK
ncbi:hypothetical protein DICVIV_11952 [Dictyocaulus viviparus]|uniref:CC domain-containing protein n=1 Tax=Dictyocaulus viviparus TaxID=29172 RepID=A0A0D8XE78_DICVI|nr:hypothetical protein DICVIV_11952 [Dictyocaulus viviparus]